MPHRRPKSWDKIEDPVCVLNLNLYGHPLAGLLWEKYCQNILIEEGFEKVPCWECLFVHRQQKLFLSIYVDDFKMSGVHKNVDKMWTTLGKRLELEEPVPIGENTYLGCGQEDVLPSPDLIAEKQDMFAELLKAEQIPKDATPEEAAI